MAALETDDVILHSKRVLARHQADGSLVRRGFRAEFVLTDTHILALGKRGEVMRIERPQIVSATVVDSLQMRASYWKPFGSPILRLEIERPDKPRLTMGIALANAEEWRTHL